MALTETRPAAASDEVPATPSAPVEPAGLAGWLSTSDHKRVGRLWIATSLLFLLVAAVLGALLGIERLDSGTDLLEGGSYPQVLALHAETLALLFVVPFFLGLATYLVPLQVGSPEIAFHRGSATAFWGYLVSAGLLVASYAADGGMTGSTSTAVDLYLLSLAVLAVSLLVGAVSVVTTVLTMRAPGMTLLDTPLFAWSVVVGGGMLLLQLPVFLAKVVGLYIPVHYAGESGPSADLSWLWGPPGVYALVVIAARVLLEVVPTLAGRPLRFPVAGIAVLGLLGVLGIGGWLTDPEAADDLLYVGMGLAAVLPPLALLGILGDTARAGTPKLRAPLVLALGSALLLLAGGTAGAVLAIEPLELAGTTWESGQVQLVLFGGGGLAALAGLWYWAPKLWGVHLSEAAGYLAALLVLGGTVLTAGPDLVAGAAEDLPRVGARFEETDLTTATGGVGVAGAALGALGALVAVGAVVAGTARRGDAAPGDPWGGWTLEWATSSPPPAHNFDEIPAMGATTEVGS